MDMEKNGHKGDKIPHSASSNSFIQIDDELEDGEINDGEANGGLDGGDSPEIVFETNNLFEVDLKPVDEEENICFVKQTEMSHLNRTLVGLVPAETPTSNKSTPRGGVCFNCSGPHSLFECQEPKDSRRITRNRSFHNQRRGDSLRMHTNQASELKPGVISDKLRRALGIENNHIPEWIFRMRSKGLYLGYPPGYMKEAMEADTIPFLEGNDSKIDKKKPVIKINTERLICYPGFNAYDPTLNDLPKNDRPYYIPNFEIFKKEYANWVQENIKPTDDIVKEIASHEKVGKPHKKRSNHDKEVASTSTTAEPNSSLTPPPTAPDLCIDNTKTPISKPLPLDKSNAEITAILGTPILLDRLSTTNPIDNKPDLVKWADGIVPFQAHEESTGKKGFIKEMMQMLNEFKQKK